MAEVGFQGGRRVCREKMGQLERSGNNNNNNNVLARPRNTAAPTTRAPATAAFKKVEIVYYLDRNGHLEHPHYVEVTHLSHQQLRLKDVMDRLTVLRGKGMPSLYSWSCKRSYKNGYVWNDLAVNDVIYPSQGAEFVLKGSELIQDKLHHDLQLGNVVQPKRKPLPSKRQQHEPEEMSNNNHNNNNKCDNYHIEEEEEEEEEEFKEQVEPHKNCASDLLLSSFSSPPSTTSSGVSDKANNDIIITNTNTNTNTNNSRASKRFEDGDQVGNEPALSINSMLLSLIACGGSASFRKTVPPPAVIKPPPPPCTVGRKSGGGGRVVEEDDTMMGRISENPRRFGKLQGEEKEYFSGSIVESMSMERIHEVQPGLLKKSSSHNEERSNVIGLREAADEEVEREKGLKGKCIPRKKSSAKH
ncbi:hypothetical protein ACP275_08G243600 [Erythranthe tilingii]